MTARRSLSIVLALPIAFALAGCITVVQQPEPEVTRIDTTPSASPAPGGDCEVVTQTATQRFDDCDELVVEGADLDIEVGTVGTLIVRGDRNDVDALEVGSLSIAGQENEIDVDGDLGTLEIAGDRNDVDVEGAVGTASINGNDNEIDADRGVDVLNDNGARNSVNR